MLTSFDAALELTPCRSTGSARPHIVAFSADDILGAPYSSRRYCSRSSAASERGLGRDERFATVVGLLLRETASFRLRWRRARYLPAMIRPKRSRHVSRYLSSEGSCFFV